MSLGSRVRVGGWICAICHLPFPCQKSKMGVEMQVLVRNSPNLLLPDRFRVKPYPSKQKKGGENLPLKDFVRGPVCWRAKMVHTWKPRKQAFWPSPECRKPFRMLPRHALSRHAGVGPWWAATAEIFKGYEIQISLSAYTSQAC